jgi:hypothetical protein
MSRGAGHYLGVRFPQDWWLGFTTARFDSVTWTITSTILSFDGIGTEMSFSAGFTFLKYGRQMQSQGRIKESTKRLYSITMPLRLL